MRQPIKTKTVALATLCLATTLTQGQPASGEIHVINLSDKKIYISSAIWFEPIASPSGTSDLQVAQGRAGFNVSVGAHLEPKNAMSFPDGTYLMIETVDFRVIDNWNPRPEHEGEFLVHSNTGVSYRTIGNSTNIDPHTFSHPELRRELVWKKFSRHQPGLLRINGRYSDLLKSATKQVGMSSRNSRNWVRREQDFRVPGQIIAIDFEAHKVKHNGEWNVYLDRKHNQVKAYADLLARDSRSGINFGKTETAEVSGKLVIHYIADGLSLQNRGKVDATSFVTNCGARLVHLRGTTYRLHYDGGEVAHFQEIRSGGAEMRYRYVGFDNQKPPFGITEIVIRDGHLGKIYGRGDPVFHEGWEGRWVKPRK